MSPKIKSVLSVVILIVVTGYVFIANLAALLGVVMSPLGLVLAVLVIAIVSYMLYRLFLKIYS